MPRVDDHNTEEERAPILAASCGVDTGRAYRLYAEVRQRASVFKAPAEPRPTDLLAMLEKLESRLGQGGSIPNAIPDHLWPYLGVAEVHEFDELTKNRAALVEALRTGIEAVRESSEYRFSRKGGRNRDSRLLTYAMDLAAIFERYTGERPTYSIAPDSGNMTSPFCRFAEEAFHQFFPEITNSPGTLKTVLQDVCRFDKTTKPLSDAELDDLLGPGREV